MSRLQQHWDARAAANFMLGGAGSGLLVVSGLMGVASPAAIAFSLLLIAAGLGAVWLEIGRKLRALHVFFNPFTSWMTRESFAALILFPLGIGAIFVPASLWFAAAAAAAFLYCQARILRASKGVPAWRAPEIVPLVVLTGLAEGASLGLFFFAGEAMLAAFALAVAARFFAWRRYRAAVGAAALEAPGKVLVGAGTVGAIFLAAAAYLVPEIAPLAGLAALAAGAWLKFALVTRASFQQGYSLPHLPVRGTR